MDPSQNYLQSFFFFCPTGLFFLNILFHLQSPVSCWWEDVVSVVLVSMHQMHLINTCHVFWPKDLWYITKGTKLKTCKLNGWVSLSWGETKSPKTGPCIGSYTAHSKRWNQAMWLLLQECQGHAAPLRHSWERSWCCTNTASSVYRLGASGLGEGLFLNSGLMIAKEASTLQLGKSYLG